VESDIDRGTITLIVQNVGASSRKLCQFEAGESLTDMVGPLGKALKEAGNHDEILRAVDFVCR
jgi:NAD(P)H-flavin reductase